MFGNVLRMVGSGLLLMDTVFLLGVMKIFWNQILVVVAVNILKATKSCTLKGEFNGMWMVSKNINWLHSYSVLLFMSQFPWGKWERKNDVFDLRTNPAHCSLSLPGLSQCLSMKAGELSRSSASFQWRGVRATCCHSLWVGGAACQTHPSCAMKGQQADVSGRKHTDSFLSCVCYLSSSVYFWNWKFIGWCVTLLV